MIYVTGDLHGDLGKFQAPALRRLGRDDVLIVCGDFGFVWNGGREEQHILRKIGKRKHQTLFVEGAHENYPQLESYPVSDYCGGKARIISGNLWHLCRGHVFTIQDKKIFAFGGADDPTIDINELADTPTLRRLPSEEDIMLANRALDLHGRAVDCIITHDCSFTLRNCLVETTSFDHLHTFLEEISRSVKFTMWYFGRYHLDRRIPPCYRAMHLDVVPIE